MKQVRSLGFLNLALLLCSLFGHAQQTSTAGQGATVIVPPLVNFSGVLTDGNGKPLNGVVGVTFYLYKDSQGGPPVWMETQNVQPDKTGHYKVTLGSATAQGVPAELFASGEARWLGVQAQDQEEQPRVLLLSVPYALKALDAETLGGKPASAFVTSSPVNSNSSSRGTGDALSGSGKKNYVPLWLSATKLGDSKIFQSTVGNLGIATTTPAALLDINGTSDLRNTLTLFPNGSAPTLSVNGTAFEVSNTGLVGFVKGQTFPGTGTITGVTTASGSGLSGGGTTGTLSLSLLKTCATGQLLQWNGNAWVCATAGTGTITGVTPGTDLTGGGTSGNVTLNLDTTKVPQLNSANTFTGNQAVTGNLSASGSISGQTGRFSGSTGVFDAVLNLIQKGSGIGLNAASGSGAAVAATSSSGFGVFAEGSTAVAGIGSIGGSFSSNGIILQGTNLAQTVEFSVDGSGNLSTGGQVTATGAGLGVLVGNVGCAAPTIGIQATNVSANCQNFALGFDGNENSTYLNRPGGGTLHFREGNGNDQAIIAPGGAVGIGTSNPNAQLDVRGSAGNSGFGVAADSSAWQARGASGWVKAMAYVDPFAQGGIAVTRCYNTQMIGSAVNTPPCGMLINHVGQGDNVIDFGFQVDDRFVTLTPSVITTDSFCDDHICGSLSANQVAVATLDNTGNPIDAAFVIMVF
jgi:hypothetical protein